MLVAATESIAKQTTNSHLVIIMTTRECLDVIQEIKRLQANDTLVATVVVIILMIVLVLLLLLLFIVVIINLELDFRRG